MHKISLDNLRFQDFELFLAVAKYGSFTKAGEKLFVTQSWVSKRMNQLEEELGLQLFFRTSPRMTLTPAGNYLKERLAISLDYFMDSLYEANRIQTGIAGTIRVGILEWGTNIIFDPLHEFIKDNPQISVDVYCQQFQEFRKAFDNEAVDLIFTTEYDNNSFLETRISSKRLCKAQIMAYMSVDNPLSEKKEINMSDLKSQEMLLLHESSSSGYNDMVLQLFANEKIRPLIAQYASNGREHIANILFGKGVLIASRFFMNDEHENLIKAVPIKGKYTYVTAVWKKDNNNPIIKLLVDKMSEKINL